ncbi:MAG: hypothetical protein J6Y99_03800, partial [Bacteroidales bacterium]|nr:hypothetical protein [Bacteroidales bacterium]
PYRRPKVRGAVGDLHENCGIAHALLRVWTAVGQGYKRITDKDVAKHNFFEHKKYQLGQRNKKNPYLGEEVWMISIVKDYYLTTDF